MACKQGACKYSKVTLDNSPLWCKKLKAQCISPKLCPETGRWVVSEFAKQYCKHYQE